MLDRNLLLSIRRNTDLFLTFALIGVLVFVIIFWMDPARRMAEARNAQRFSHTETILSAVKLYQIDNNGETPPQIDGTYRMLGATGEGCGVQCGVNGRRAADACLDAQDTLGKYLDNIPIDPLYGDSERSFYAVTRTEHKAIRVVACGAELGRYIQMAR